MKEGRRSFLDGIKRIGGKIFWQEKHEGFE
jgi:hypothetical protein